MCDPFSLIMLAGGAVGAAGSLFGGSRNADALRFQAEIAAGNVDILNKQAGVQRGEAQLAADRAGFEAGRAATAIARTQGGQAAYFGASGLEGAYGSPLLLAGATAAQGAVDLALIGAQGALDRSAGLQRVAQTLSGAAGQAGQAYSSAEAANNSIVAGVFGAATALLGSAAKAWPGLASGAAGASQGPGFAVSASGAPAAPGAFNPFKIY